MFFAHTQSLGLGAAIMRLGNMLQSIRITMEELAQAEARKTFEISFFASGDGGGPLPSF